MIKEFYVAMTISEKIVPSSAIYSGTEIICGKCAKRLNRRKEKHVSVGWVVLPCV